MSTAIATSFTLDPVAATPDAASMQSARALLAGMSLDEKLALVAGNGTMTLAANPRIGLVEEFWFSDGPHTVRPELERNNFNSANRQDDHSTLMPSLCALAATWDTGLARQFGETLGREARHRGKDVLLGPGMNLQRTPLNGRNYEYLGEDPHLAARMAVAYVTGLQSMDVAACVKHFVCNDQELERGSVDVNVDERTLRELYLAPFEAAIIEAGALTVMNGYNRFRGEFCSHNSALNNLLLKEEWGFPGFVVSDWGGVHDTVGGALGGVDVEMHAGDAIRHFRTPLRDAVLSGRVPAAVVDGMALRVLYVMARVGKLGGRTRAAGERNSSAHQLLARTVAEDSIVLLRNAHGVLPLSPDRIASVLVIGPNADMRHAPGGWSAEGKPPYEATPLQGLRSLLGDRRVKHIAGPFCERFERIPESVIQTVDAADLEHGAAQRGWRIQFFPTHSPACAAESFVRDMSALRADGAFSGLAGAQGGCFVCSTEIIAPESGTYRFSLRHEGLCSLQVAGSLVLETGRGGPPVTRTATAHLSAGQRCVLRIECTPESLPAECELRWLTPSLHPVGPEALAAEAAGHDAVVFITGNRLGHGRAHEGEGADRPDLSLPEGDDAAIAAVLRARPDAVVVVQSGAPVAMPWIDAAATVVQFGFAGMEAGNALARVLFGIVNPSGHLPFSIPRHLADTAPHALGAYHPVRVDYSEGVLIGYRWLDAQEIEPLFPFGHGLSYTTFSVGQPVPARDVLGPGEALRVAVEVRNTGGMSGRIAVQLYMGKRESALVRAPRELKAFAKVRLEPGEARTVELELPARSFAHWDDTVGAWAVEPGDYLLQSGLSSRTLSRPVIVRMAEA